MIMSASGTVEQVVHYYPYGMAFAEGTNADAQRFKYNGKELDAVRLREEVKEGLRKALGMYRRGNDAQS